MAKRQLYSTIVAEDLKKHISAAQLKPGDQLPTEAELCAQYSVSRTVIREAISRLQSEDLVEARQGKGVFISENVRSHRFAINWQVIKSLPDTRALMELRLAIEVESAGLCAQRRSNDEAAKIRHILDEINDEAERQEAHSIIHDYKFHLAIAQASGNAYLVQLLETLEPLVVSGFSLNSQVDNRFNAEYSDIAGAEHETIVAAIEKRRPAAARRSMHSHLRKSIDRFMNVAEYLSDHRIEPDAELGGDGWVPDHKADVVKLMADLFRHKTIGARG